MEMILMIHTTPLEAGLRLDHEIHKRFCCQKNFGRTKKERSLRKTGGIGDDRKGIPRHDYEIKDSEGVTIGQSHKRNTIAFIK